MYQMNSRGGGRYRAPKVSVETVGARQRMAILTEYGHETLLSKLVAANEQDLAHFSIDGTPNKSFN